MMWVALAWLKSRLSALLGVVVRYPLQAALILSLCACWWLWRGKERAQDNLTAAYAAWDKAKVDQEALRVKERADYERKADAADTEYHAALAGVRADTARFIASRRVQPSRISAAQPVSEADTAAVPEAVPSGVVVGEADVRACADLYVYAVSAHDWAVSVGK